MYKLNILKMDKQKCPNLFYINLLSICIMVNYQESK